MGAFDVPLSDLDPAEKAKRATSFGAIADHYERYRPGPSIAAVEWILPSRVGRVIDLGAGTGALSRLLVSRADEVVAVEPDDRMRAVLADEVPGVRAVKGTGESMPLPDSCADAVLASTSWHWMDPVPTLHEVGRVLQPGGTLAVMWSGPDPEGPFLLHAQALLAEQAAAAATATAGNPAPAQGGDAAGGSELSGLVMGEARRPISPLEIPGDVPFHQPEHRVFTWDVAFQADDLVGLLGTLSSIITLPDTTREAVLAEARRLLRELLGVEGDVTVDVTFRSDVWKTQRQS
jgi:SAM-dependent methyltransferase